MFDKLVESTKQKPAGRSKFFLLTSLIYGAALTTLLVLTIMWFDPVPAEAFNAAIMLAPPSVPPAPPQNTSKPVVVDNIAPQFVTPAIPRTIADAKTVPPRPIVNKPQIYIPGTVDIGSSSNARSVGVGNLNTDNSEPPPPPVVKPMPKVEPTPETPRIVPMTSIMITGKAIRKVQPPYPPIAKAAHVSGSVQIQILISEEGRVLSATTVTGNPLLRDAAAQAAREWVFSPTILNGKGVKVSGVISFNFTLN